MASLEQRMAVFRQLPIRAQLATITSTKANEILAKNTDYIAQLEAIHAESLAQASASEKLAYQKSQDLLGS